MAASEFSGVTVLAKANVYFDGNVISHTVLLPAGEKKTLGIIRPGTYHFGTEAAERMELVDGLCSVTIDGSTVRKDYSAHMHFDVPAKSGFTIEVTGGLCEYVCSFLS